MKKKNRFQRFLKGRSILTALSLIVACATSAMAVPSAVTQLGTPASQYGASNTLSSFTVPAGTDRLLVVSVGHTNSTSITNCTFGGTAMTQVAFEQDGFASDAFYILELGTGSAVTGDIVMTPGAGVPDEKFMAAVAYSNVDQTTPTSSAMNREEQNAAGINSTLTVTSEDGDLVFAVFDAFHNTATVTTTLGAGKTVVHSTGSQSIDSGGEGTYTTTTQDGATSVTSNFTTNGEAIIHMAMNINAANFSPTQTVNVSVSPTPSIAENGGNITITATAGGAVSGAQTVDLALSGAATAVDFSGALPTQITIADGATSGSVTAAVFDDALDENNETATFTISNPSSGLTLGATTSASTDINDNDPTPTVSLSLSGSPFDENAGTATVTATLSAVSGLPVTVPLTFGGGAAGPGASDDYLSLIHI